MCEFVLIHQCLCFFMFWIELLLVLMGRSRNVGLGLMKAWLSVALY